MKIIEHNGYKELQVTFKEFIKLIRPDDKSELEKYFKTTNRNFIFRGQSNSSYELIPSAFREDVSYSPIAQDYLGFCFRQYAFLKSFVHGCDLNAVSIPNDSHSFREQIFDSINNDCFNPNIWPDKRLYELIGLAQHYGYPTEFLDWSYNPLVACYFAASGVIKNTKKIKKDDSMSIWIFDTEQIYSVNIDNQVNLELINIPRSLNINISAQEGCFTLVRQNLFSREKLTFENRRIKEIRLISDLMHEKNQVGLLKITIKSIDATNILDYCSSYRINAATLFRGYEGAAQYAIDSMSYNRFHRINGIKSRGMSI